MTPAELGSVFQVEDHDDVPEYEVVTVHHRRQRRGADRGLVHQVRILEVNGGGLDIPLQSLDKKIAPPSSVNLVELISNPPLSNFVKQERERKNSTEQKSFESKPTII